MSRSAAAQRGLGAANDAAAAATPSISEDAEGASLVPGALLLPLAVGTDIGALHRWAPAQHNQV